MGFRLSSLLFLVLAGTLALSACDGLTGTKLKKEKNECKGPNCPELPKQLVVKADYSCVDTTVSATVENLIDSVETEYTIANDSTGEKIANGFVSDNGSVPPTKVSSDGPFTITVEDSVKATSTKRKAQSTAEPDCFETPVGPGNLRVTDNFGCEERDDGYYFDGFFQVKATRGWEQIALINVPASDTLVYESGITPVSGQTRTFSGLDDVRYKVIAWNGGSSDKYSATAEHIPSCNRGPGEITVDKTCNGDNGEAGFALTVENGFESFEIMNDGNVFDEGSGFTPEPNQTLSRDDVPNGDWKSNFERVGKSGSIKFSVDCQEKNKPPTAKFDFETDELTVDFDGSDSFDPDGEIASYEWKFGDGSTSSGVTPTHTYDSPGAYSVTLTVIDKDDLDDSITKDVTVDADPKKCECRYDVSGDRFVAGKAKFDLTGLLSDVNLVPVEPYSDWVNVRVDSRYGPQTQENYGIGWHLASNEADSTLSDIKRDRYDGNDEAWVYRDFELPADFFPVDKEVDLFAFHSHLVGGEHNNGRDDVWFADAAGKKLAADVPEVIRKNNNAPSVAMTASGSIVKSHDRGAQIRVTFEVAPGEDCPPRYDPVD